MMFVLRSTLLILWFFISSAIAAATLVFRPYDIRTDYRWLQLFTSGAQRIVRIRHHVDGKKHLRSARPCIYICNHQHVLDALLVREVYLSGTAVVGKKEIRRIPIFGWMFERAGNVFVDRSDRAASIASLAAIGERMHAERLNLWMFPEGKRNKTENGLQPFKKGAFYTAVQLGAPIVPIVTGPTWHFLNMHKKKLRPGEVYIKVLPPIAAGRYDNETVDDLIAETHRQMSAAFVELEQLTFPEYNDTAIPAPAVATAQ